MQIELPCHCVGVMPPSATGGFVPSACPAAVVVRGRTPETSTDKDVAILAVGSNLARASVTAWATGGAANTPSKLWARVVHYFGVVGVPNPPSYLDQDEPSVSAGVSSL